MQRLDKNSPNIFVELQGGQLIERLSIWVPMIYETIESETLYIRDFNILYSRCTRSD